MTAVKLTTVTYDQNNREFMEIRFTGTLTRHPEGDTVDDISVDTAWLMGVEIAVSSELEKALIDLADGEWA